MTSADARHIVLVGMMGAGKTTVGHRLAARLGRRMVDSDELIEARTGRTVRRDLRDATASRRSACWRPPRSSRRSTTPEPLVIAAAGGVLMRPENREALQRSGALVVWLRADPAVLAGAGDAWRPPPAARR